MAWQRVDRVEEVRPLFQRDAPDFQLVLVLRDCGVNAFAIVGAMTEPPASAAWPASTTP
jgi:hypothetical protein